MRVFFGKAQDEIGFRHAKIPRSLVTAVQGGLNGRVQSNCQSPIAKSSHAKDNPLGKKAFSGTARSGDVPAFFRSLYEAGISHGPGRAATIDKKDAAFLNGP
jgi:hypothetical protein